MVRGILVLQSQHSRGRVHGQPGLQKTLSQKRKRYAHELGSNLEHIGQNIKIKVELFSEHKENV